MSRFLQHMYFGVIHARRQKQDGTNRANILVYTDVTTSWGVINTQKLQGNKGKTPTRTPSGTNKTMHFRYAAYEHTAARADDT